MPRPATAYRPATFGPHTLHEESVTGRKTKKRAARAERWSFGQAPERYAAGKRMPPVNGDRLVHDADGGRRMAVVRVGSGDCLLKCARVPPPSKALRVSFGNGLRPPLTVEVSAPPPVRNQGAQAGACPDRTQAIPCSVLAHGKFFVQSVSVKRPSSTPHHSWPGRYRFPYRECLYHIGKVNGSANYTKEGEGGISNEKDWINRELMMIQIVICYKLKR